MRYNINKQKMNKGNTYNFNEIVVNNKGKLVNKGGYDCDYCCCGGTCSCCCGHQKPEIPQDTMNSSFEDQFIQKTIIIEDRKLFEPPIIIDNIETGMSNILFNQSGNLNTGIVCVLGVGIITGFYLINRLVNIDEKYPTVIKCFDINLIKRRFSI